ncbi:hypothetical protein LJK88_15960 [Paenibacillus sp. P26]|nr:hypothetical protein LJK88_15960 [Paenibacillus sp. P26]
MPSNEPAMDETLTSAYSVPSARKKSRRLRVGQDWRLYALLAVPMLYFLVFKYIPMYGVTIAFKDFNMFQGDMEQPLGGAGRIPRNLLNERFL